MGNTTIGKDQTIGVEVEFTGVTRADAAKAVAGVLHTGAYAYVGGAYKTWEIRACDGRIWKVQRDSSISLELGGEQCELVTPILRYDDIPTLQEVVRAIRRIGGRSSAALGCGVHIHIGADGHTAQTLRTLTNIMASHEKLLIDALQISRQRIGSYCKMVAPEFLNKVNARKPKTMDELRAIWYANSGSLGGVNPSRQHYDQSRYHVLNLHAVFSKGTIEFRLFQFNNGVHAGELKSWIFICMALSNAAKTLKTASPREPQRDNDKFAMRTWLIRLGFIGDEFKNARAHLSKHLSGNAAWRFGERTA